MTGGDTHHYTIVELIYSYLPCVLSSSFVAALASVVDWVVLGVVSGLVVGFKVETVDCGATAVVCSGRVVVGLADVVVSSGLYQG